MFGMSVFQSVLERLKSEEALEGDSEAETSDGLQSPIGRSPAFVVDTPASTTAAFCAVESAYRDLDATSANGIAYVRDNLCFPIAAGSFEEGMGA